MEKHDRLRTTIRVTVAIEPDEDGYYAYCPGLQGVQTGGDTGEEALTNARDAVIGILRSRLKHGDPIGEGPFLQIIKPSEEQRRHLPRHEDLLVQV